MGQDYLNVQPAGKALPTPAVVGPPQKNNVELRLQRLEAVTNEILQELRRLRQQNMRRPVAAATANRINRFPADSGGDDPRRAMDRERAMNALDDQIRVLVLR